MLLCKVLIHPEILKNALSGYVIDIDFFASIIVILGGTIAVLSDLQIVCGSYLMINDLAFVKVPAYPSSASFFAIVD